MKLNVKRTIYYYIAALAVVSLYGCSEEPAEILQPEPDYASVSLSSREIVMPEEGGQKTIFVATNREDWDVVCIEDWVDVSIEGGSVTFYVDGNTSEGGRIAVAD